MRRAPAILAVLVAFAVLAICVDQPWAWALIQSSVFVYLAVWTGFQWLRPTPVHLVSWFVPLAAAPLWGLLQLATHHTIYRHATWMAVLNWTTYLALFFLALQLFQSTAARHWFLRSTVYFGFFLSVLSTLQMLTSGGRFFWLFPSGYNNFVMGPFVNPNQYAAFIELLLPVTLWFALSGRHTLSHTVMAAAMFASVVASASRAGFVLVACEIAAVLVLAYRRRLTTRRTFVPAAAVFVVIALLLAALVGPQSLLRHLHDPDTLAGRREFVVSSLAMLRDRPAMGFGLGNWARAYPAYAIFDNGAYINQAHNDWLQWAVEGGIPFLAILLALVLMALPAALRSVWAIGLPAVCLHALVDYPFQQRPAISACFFTLLGLLATTLSKSTPKSEVHKSE